MTQRPPSFRSPLRHGLSVASRTLAAVAGGYALSLVTAAVFALALPLEGEERVTAGSLIAFAVMPAAILWAFAARTAWRAWLGLLAPGLALTAALYFLRGSLA